MLVVAGNINRLLKTSKTQVRHVKEIIPHPRYVNYQLKFDVALIILREDLNLDGISAEKIPLADHEYPDGTKCTVFGWGRLFEDGPVPAELVYADLELWPEELCQSQALVAPGMICAKNQDDYEVDSCHGDSGGPLISNNTLIGVVSWGRGCGSRYTSGVYTDVFYFRDWILQNIQNIPNNTQQLKECKFLFAMILITMLILT